MNVRIANPTLVEKAPENLQQVLKSGSIRAFESVSEITACLTPLLDALNWRGDKRDIAEALPHFALDLTVMDLRNSLAHLGYDSSPIPNPLGKMDSRLAPFLFVPDVGAPLVVFEADEEGFTVFDSSAREIRRHPRRDRAGTAYVFRLLKPDTTPAHQRPQSWFGELLQRFRPDIKHLLLLSLALNSLALAIPLFILALYDKVIPTGSVATLIALTGGVLLALGFEFGFRYLRSNLIAFVGGRFDYLIGTAIFRRLLDLPPAQTEQAPLGSQISRLRELYAIRSVFTGPLCIAIFDLPFVLLFLLVIFLLGGWLIVVPLAAMALLVLVAYGMKPHLSKLLHRSATATSAHQSFLVETTTKVRAIKYHGMEDVWADRHRDISAKSAMEAYALGRFANALEVFAEITKLAAGVGTLTVGIMLVLGGSISIGALIASMALVWRALSPIQVLFLTASKLEQARMSIRSTNALMNLPPERPPVIGRRSRKAFAGRVTFGHVSYRYRNDHDPAVLGVSLDIKPGEVVALAGSSGAGKSTLLKLVLGMHMPQSGNILIDGLDVRQLDRVQLRQSIAYMPQTCQFFHGTVAQNLRLADPTATDERLREAARDAQILDEILAMPEGFETRLSSDQQKNMPHGLRQRLSIARTFVRDARIILLDEPGNGLDEEGDHALSQAIRQKRGDATIIIGTHRPSQMELADRIFVLDHGTIRGTGSPDEIMPRLMRAKR